MIKKFDLCDLNLSKSNTVYSCKPFGGDNFFFSLRFVPFLWEYDLEVFLQETISSSL